MIVTILLGLVVVLAFAVVGCVPTLQTLEPLFIDDQPVVELSFSNADVVGVRYYALFTYLILKSLFRRLFGSRLVLDKTDSADSDASHRIANFDKITVEIPLLSHRSNVRHYYQACDKAKPSGNEDEVEQLCKDLRHVQLYLFTQTFASVPLLLSRSKCPIDAIGAVNVSTEIHLVDVVACLDVVRRSNGVGVLKGLVQGILVRAWMDDRANQARRGWEHDIVVELVKPAGDVTIFKVVFKMLQFASHRTPFNPPSKENQDTGDASTNTDTPLKVKVHAKDPGRWANLSKDKNPIHTSYLAARLLGLPGRIAHGLHVVAKAVEVAKQQGNEEGVGSKGMFVQLRKPVPVPSTLDLSSHVDNKDSRPRWDLASKGRLQTQVTFQ
jgi:acyl dehydratase